LRRIIVSGELHELIAVFPNLKGTAERAVNNSKKTLGDKQHQFNGHMKTYRPFEDAQENQEPPEASLMTLTVGEELEHFTTMFAPFLDAELQMATTNMLAKANLKVGELEIEDVPVVFLIQLDKAIGDLRKVFDSVPVLDPKFNWNPDDQKGKGIWKTDPESSFRTKKVLQSKELFKGDEHHPPQIEKWQEDVKIGEYTTERHSGMLTVSQKITLLRRLDELQKAVKKARSKANKIEHSTDDASGMIFNYLLEGIPRER
jgi:hypothetical protein